jgi:subtilisin family serine protease
MAAAAAAVLLPAAGASSAPSRGLTEVVVTLAEPPLAAARPERALASVRGRLDLRAPAAVSYMRHLAAAQRELHARIAAAIPGARVAWRYTVTLNGLAVVVPRGSEDRLARLPGVAKVWPSFTYHALLDRTPALIGATSLWGPSLANAGNGVKIGVIDDGIDQTHPFFSASGFSYPAGFPKGQRAFATPKVIVARAFAPKTTHWKYARRPFDPAYSDHATHVAGIAAGDHDTPAMGTRVSGIAPRAYLGNYKALTVPTEKFGLDGNSPEIAAAIEQAVKDGMDVLNLSLGEPEVDPARDLVVRAIDRATAAGVVVVVAAGNDYGDFGRGSIGSPGSASDAISVAAATGGHDSGTPDVIAGFSSSGPTPVSLQLKPDVTAPGVGVLSSVPKRDGSWDAFSGTSMASPHVAGAVALLRQRHPTWTPAQLKSALAQTAVPAYSSTAKTSEAPATREGGGRIDLTRAVDPLVFAEPATVSFGLLRAGSEESRTVTLQDAGGGAGGWTATVSLQATAPGVTVTAPPAVNVPGPLVLTATASASAAERDVTGFLVLTRVGVTRRIPFWFRTESPRLATEPHTDLTRAGIYRGDTAGKPSLVTSYRYPDNGGTLGLPVTLAGPEQVFRFRVTRTIANFGVAVLAGAGRRIQPRIVFAGDENRVVGYAGLPVNLNPYLPTFGRLEPVAGVDVPARGDYDIVFDSESAARAGRFKFRFWINDARRPAIRLLARTATARSGLRLSLTDRGSGVDPAAVFIRVDGTTRAFTLGRGRLVVDLHGVSRGRHRVTVQASDYQEAKNMENVPRILPNTRILSARFTVR